MRILITGAAGFVGTAVVRELLALGHEVVGLDDLSGHGPARHDADTHPRYKLVVADAADVKLLRGLLGGCDHFVVGAARSGGSNPRAPGYDQLSANARLLAAAFDAALAAYRTAELRKVTVLSSAAVFENATADPLREGDQRTCPPPRSADGFVKLAAESFARAAYDQHGLPYTIARVFDPVGVGGWPPGGPPPNPLLDLVAQVVGGKSPLRLGQHPVRAYTAVADLARGVRLCVEHPSALNEEFNLSAATPVGLDELADRVWEKVHGTARPVGDGSPSNAPSRVPDVSKARALLGFTADTPLDAVLDEVISWVAGRVVREASPVRTVDRR